MVHGHASSVTEPAGRRQHLRALTATYGHGMIERERPRPRRDQWLARLAERGRPAPRWVVVAGTAVLVVMTVWGFVRSLA